jgi:hypothetical protein
MAGQGFGRAWASGDEFAEFMRESNDSLGEVMREVGLAN